jgi:signal transduction histidine kinase
MISIQQRLRHQLLLALLLVLTTTLMLLDYGVRHLTQGYILSRLQHDSDSLLAALDQDDNDQWQLPTERQSSLYQAAYSGHYFVVLTPGGRLVSRSLWDLTTEPATQSPGQHASGEMDGPEQQKWLWLATGAEINNQPVTIWVAEDIGPLKQQLQLFRFSALGLILATLVLLLLWQRQALRRAFILLQPLQQQLRDMRFGDVDIRAETMPLEVQPLVSEIQRLLHQLENRVSRSRNAIGNLAHDMKRPLQQLRLLGEQLDDTARQQQSSALNELQRMVERELRRARIAGVSSPGRQTALAEDIPPLIDVLRRIYPQHVINSDYPQQGYLPQDRDDMLELLGNLLDNACKYGQKNVRLLLQRDNSHHGWCIQVSDDGPGIATDLATHLLQRGTRLDESGSGSGLGLAICQDIINSYGGSLQLLAASPTGGLKVRIFLPDQ